jgi:vacuolar-type H+-ATPase subunit I/STV1
LALFYWKDTQVPDIQTALADALKTTINNWEKEDMQTTQTNTQPKSTRFFDITNNVTRATFDYVKHRPNETSAEICASMAKLGYKESSVGSLLAQFAKQGLAERDDRGRYITIVPEYKPLKNKKKEAKVVAKPVETPKRKYEKRSEGIAALQPDVSETPAPKRFVTLVRSKTPDDILKDMTVFQARELYDYLKKMFGG